MTEAVTLAPAQDLQATEQPKETVVEEPAASAAAPAEHTPAPAAIEAKEDDEPQNELTKKFSDEEWKALKELRSKLPEIFVQAYHPEDSSAKAEPITIWGVTIDPHAPTSDAKVSVVLMKFLRARELDVSKAQDMLIETLKWRKEFDIDSLMTEEFDDAIFGKIGYIAGHDKEGRPVNYNLYGAQDVKTVFGDVPRFIRWRVQLMERSIQTLDFEKIDQMIQVHDYAGVRFMGGRDANQKAAAAQATDIFQNHYPEFLALKFFISVPTVLTWIFWFFKPLVSAKTFAKMNVVGTSKSAIAGALLPVVDENQLPERYGGKAEDLA